MVELMRECSWCHGTGREKCPHNHAVHYAVHFMSGTRKYTDVPGVTYCSGCDSYFTWNNEKQTLMPLSHRAFEIMRAAWDRAVLSTPDLDPRDDG